MSIVYNGHSILQERKDGSVWRWHDNFYWKQPKYLTTVRPWYCWPFRKVTKIVGWEDINIPGYWEKICSAATEENSDGSS